MITSSQRKKFIEAYEKLSGTDIRLACKAAKISHSSLYRLFAEDPQFKAKVDRIRSKRIPKDIHVVMNLIDKARMGNMRSINKFLDYSYGKPQKADLHYYCRKCGDHLSAEEEAQYLEWKRQRTFEAEKWVNDVLKGNKKQGGR